MLRRRFQAMGTDVELFLDGDEGPELLDLAEVEIRRLGRLLSRFEPDSDLSRLNRMGAMRVGPELLELARLSVEARAATEGRFDPTIHDALVHAGYDRTFDDLERGEREPPTRPSRCGGGVEVDVARSTVALEPGFRLDLGGIAKGWTADRVVAMLSRRAPALVDVGGDVAGAGRPWPVGVETPEGTVTLELRSGGLATSGRDRRAWERDGVEQHHLIDPSTAAPADGGVLRVTAAARTATEAEVLAKSLFLAGDVHRAAAEADERGIPAVLVARDGATLLAGGIA